MSIDEMIAIWQAAKEGKTIEFENFNCKPAGHWDKFDVNDFCKRHSLRVKPREIWISDGRIGDHFESEDRCRDVCGGKPTRFREVLENES